MISDFSCNFSCKNLFQRVLSLSVYINSGTSFIRPLWFPVILAGLTKHAGW